MFFAHEAIKYFKSEGLKIALVTSSPQEQMILKHKPHPDLYLLALDKIDLKAEWCLAFEDTQYGVEAAKSAEVTCFAIPNELTKNQDFSKADKVFSNLKEAVDYVKMSDSKTNIKI